MPDHRCAIVLFGPYASILAAAGLKYFVPGSNGYRGPILYAGACTKNLLSGGRADEVGF